MEPSIEQDKGWSLLRTSYSPFSLQFQTGDTTLICITFISWSDNFFNILFCRRQYNIEQSHFIQKVNKTKRIINKIYLRTYKCQCNENKRSILLTVVFKEIIVILLTGECRNVRFISEKKSINSFLVYFLALTLFYMVLSLFLKKDKKHTWKQNKQKNQQKQQQKTPNKTN